MIRLGLLAKTVILLLLIFAGATVALHRLYVPSLERRVREQLLDVAGECLGTGKKLMYARSRNLVERNRRGLEDLPFELTAGDADHTRDAERTRELVRKYAEGFGKEDRKNVDLLNREFMDRMGDDSQPAWPRTSERRR